MPDRSSGKQPTRRYHLPSALRASSLRIAPAAAEVLLTGGALLIDVRRKDDPAHPVHGAARVPPDEIPGFLQGLAPGAQVILACT